MSHPTSRDVAVIRMASEVARDPYAAERSIRAEFDLSVLQFLQLVNRLLADPVVLAACPVEVRRLRRIRDSRLRPARRLSA